MIKNILNQLFIQGYDTSDYEDFGINEVHIMTTNNQLDMLITTPEQLAKEEFLNNSIWFHGPVFFALLETITW